jgi:hypothetical protein
VKPPLRFNSLEEVKNKKGGRNMIKNLEKAIKEGFTLEINKNYTQIIAAFSSKVPSHEYSNYHFCRGEIMAYYLSPIDTWEIEVYFPSCVEHGGKWWIREVIGGYKATRLPLKVIDNEEKGFTNIEDLINFFFNFDHNSCGYRGATAFRKIVEIIGWK